MANEAVLVLETHQPIPMTVANGTGIEKGAVLKIADLMTASLADGTNDFVAGIAASEKIASDGKVRLGVYRGGIFKMICSGAVLLGSPVGTTATYPNHISDISTTNELSGCQTLGIALELGANTETILVEVRPHCGHA